MADQLEQILREVEQPVHPRAEFGDQLLGRLLDSLGEASAQPPARRGFPVLRELVLAAAVVLFVGALAAGVYALRAAQHSAPARTAPTSQTVPIETAQFFNAQDGAVVTQRGLLITHDGGQSWQLQTQLQLDWQGVNDVRFIDANQIVIVSRSANGLTQLIHSTADGGAHWQTNPIGPVARPGDNLALFFLNAREGWQETDSGFPTTGKLLPSGPNPTAPSDLALYQTTDAGAHWTQLWRVGTSQSSTPGPALAGFPNGLLFTDSMHGFMGTGTYDNIARLYVTRDGGRTWQFAVIPAPPGGWASGCCGKVFTSPAVTMFGDRGLVAQGDPNRAAVYSTSDGGQSWGAPRLLPSGVARPFFLSPSHWWALVDSTVYETVDAGASWKHVAVQWPSGTGGLASDPLTKPPVLWGVAGGSISGVPKSACYRYQDPFGAACMFLIRSTDGGAHWTIAKLP